VRSGSGTAPPPKGSGAKQQPATNAAFAADQGDGGGTSPLVPIAIALGAGGLVLGGGWWANRRFHA
jgi:hypothetical protein